MVREFLEHLACLPLRKALRQGIGEVRTCQNPILRQAKTARAREFLEGIGGKGVIRGCGGKKGDGGKGNLFRNVRGHALGISRLIPWNVRGMSAGTTLPLPILLAPHFVGAHALLIRLHLVCKKIEYAGHLFSRQPKRSKLSKRGGRYHLNHPQCLHVGFQDGFLFPALVEILLA